MNCAQFLELTGWECLSAGAHTIRAISPLTLGADGQHAAFYIAQPDETSFYLTDAGETAMHASMFGIELTKTRIDTLNRTAGAHFAQFDYSGAITAEGQIALAQHALWGATKLAMSLSFFSQNWMPKFDQMRLPPQYVLYPR